jgi:hypothetical protein
VPASHSEQDTAPDEGEKRPAAHELHDDSPVALAYEPVPHAVQEVDPVEWAIRPSAHEVHEEANSAEYLPTPQAVQKAVPALAA